VTHDTAGIQYGDGLSRDPMFVLLSERMISGAGSVSGQNGKAGEDANEFDPLISSHCGNLTLFVVR
jgi:hypothetical protein